MKRKIIVVLLALSFLGCMFGAATAQGRGTKILEQVSKSTVRIELQKTINLANFLDIAGAGSTTVKGSGTGFFINDHQIITNHHVISSSYLIFQTLLDYISDDASSLLETIYDEFWFESAEGDYVNVVYSVNGNDSIQGLVVADWPDLDLAVVEIDPNFSKRVPLKLSNGSNIQVGMDIYVVGYPGVMQSDKLTYDNAAITAGVLSKLTKSQEGIFRTSTPFTQLNFDATVNHGNSGGPIVDRDGNVIGVVSSMTNIQRGIAYFGIHVDEVIAKLNSRSYTYFPAKNSNLLLWIAVGVLGAAVIAAAILLFRKPTPKTSVVPEAEKKQQSSSSASVDGLTGQFTGQRKSLSQSKDMVFGKDPSACTVVFAESERTVSRKHCRIHFSNTYQRDVIQDLGSQNGTVLLRGSSQKKVPSNSGIALKNGDVIYIPNKNNSFRVNI